VQFELVTKHDCDGRCAEGTRCPGDAKDYEAKVNEAQSSDSAGATN
jgi:hypothetical protein